MLRGRDQGQSPNIPGVNKIRRKKHQKIAGLVIPKGHA